MSKKSDQKLPHFLQEKRVPRSLFAFLIAHLILRSVQAWLEMPGALRSGAAFLDRLSRDHGPALAAGAELLSWLMLACLCVAGLVADTRLRKPGWSLAMGLTIGLIFFRASALCTSFGF